MASEVAIFRWNKCLDSTKGATADSSDPTFQKLDDIRERLDRNSTFLTTPESISLLSDLEDALADRLILQEHKSIKRFFACSCGDPTKQRLSDIISKVDGHLSNYAEDSSSSISFLLDRYTFYKPDHRITSIEGEVTDECEKQLVSWLSGSGVQGFKTVGICGMGGSGKTALVKNVLEHKSVRDKFTSEVDGKHKHNIIWACLSDLTLEAEVNDSIVIYLLYRLGLDTDSLSGNVDGDKGGLMEELKRRLLKLRKYVVVLDDLWHCSKWLTDFLAELKKHADGAVIVTSRRRTVVEKICKKEFIVHRKPWAPYKENVFFSEIHGLAGGVRQQGDNHVEEMIRYCDRLVPLPSPPERDCSFP